MHENSEGAMFFAQHFSPILFLFIPIYYIFQSPLTLLIIHGAAAAIAVIPLYFLAYTLTGHRFFSNSITLSYIISRTVNYAVMFDFHQEILYPFLFLFVFYFAVKNKWIWFYIFVILCISVKEDANIILIGIGAYLFYKKQKLHGLITASIAVIMIIATYFLILPYFRGGEGDYRFITFWSDYGNSSKEILINMLNPIKNSEVIFTSEKLKSMFNLFSVYIFLPLFSPAEFVFLIFPAFFIMYSSSNYLIYTPLLYYGMLITPMLIYTTIISVKKLKEKWRTSIIIISILLISINLLNSRLYKQFFQENWAIPERYNYVLEMLKEIPDDEPISAQINLLPRINPRSTREMFPNGLEKAKYILLDLEGNTYPLGKAEYLKVTDSLKSNSNWEGINFQNNFVLLKRR